MEQQVLYDIVGILSSGEVEVWDRSKRCITKIPTSALMQVDPRLGDCFEVTFRNYKIANVKRVNEALFTFFEGEPMACINYINAHGYSHSFGNIASYAQLPDSQFGKTFWLKRNKSGDDDGVFWRVAQVGYGYASDITPGNPLSYTGVCVHDLNSIPTDMYPITIATLDGKLFTFNPMHGKFSMTLGAWVKFDVLPDSKTNHDEGRVNNHRFVGIDPPVETFIGKGRVGIKLECKWLNGQIVPTRFPEMQLTVNGNIQQMFKDNQYLIIEHFGNDGWIAAEVEEEQPSSSSSTSEKATVSMDRPTSHSPFPDDAKKSEILRSIANIIENKQIENLMRAIDDEGFSRLRRILFRTGYLKKTLKEEMVKSL